MSKESLKGLYGEDGPHKEFLYRSRSFTHEDRVAFVNAMLRGPSFGLETTDEDKEAVARFVWAAMAAAGNEAWPKMGLDKCYDAARLVLAELICPCHTTGKGVNDAF